MHIYMCILHNFAHIFYEINRFPTPKPIFLCLRFQRESPVEENYPKVVYYFK